MDGKIKEGATLARDGGRKEVTGPVDHFKVCPKYEKAVQILGKKWTGLVIRVLLSGKKRFCELKASMPDLSDRVLSERLKELEDEGIVVRRVHHTRPVLIEYELTEKGRALEPVVAAIQEWADRWFSPKAELPPGAPHKARPPGEPGAPVPASGPGGAGAPGGPGAG